jgi:hypothetical protein
MCERNTHPALHSAEGQGEIPRPQILGPTRVNIGGKTIEELYLDAGLAE